MVRTQIHLQILTVLVMGSFNPVLAPQLLSRLFITLPSIAKLLVSMFRPQQYLQTLTLLVMGSFNPIIAIYPSEQGISVFIIGPYKYLLTLNLLVSGLFNPVLAILTSTLHVYHEIALGSKVVILETKPSGQVPSKPILILYMKCLNTNQTFHLFVL